MTATGSVSPPVYSWWFRRPRIWQAILGLLVAVLGLACFASVLVLAVFAMIKGSDAYARALAQARSNRVVIHELGEPIEPGWWVLGSINLLGSRGSAEFSTPLRGPSGRATLYVAAEKDLGRWHFKVLEVAVEGEANRINLLGENHGAL